MTIMHFDTITSSRRLVVRLENLTADATAINPDQASATVLATSSGQARRIVNGSSSTMFDWIEPRNFAPGDYEMQRGTSAPFDLNGGFGAGYGPLAFVWTPLTSTVSWGFMTSEDSVTTADAIFPVYIRENPGTPGPIIDTAQWRIKITRLAQAPGGGGGGCFTGNMRVLMADGREKRIADILVGEAVMSLNTQTGDLVASRVNDLMVPRFCDIYELHLSNGKVIETTSEHPFRTVSGKWAAIDPTVMITFRDGRVRRTPAQMHITEGLLLHGAEEHARVTKIVETGRKETVYHLAHVGMRNFFVEGFCVHNIEFLEESQVVK